MTTLTVLGLRMFPKSAVLLLRCPKPILRVNMMVFLSSLMLRDEAAPLLFLPPRAARVSTSLHAVEVGRMPLMIWPLLMRRANDDLPELLLPKLKPNHPLKIR